AAAGVGLAELADRPRPLPAAHCLGGCAAPAHCARLARRTAQRRLRRKPGHLRRSTYPPSEYGSWVLKRLLTLPARRFSLPVTEGGEGVIEGAEDLPIGPPVDGQRHHVGEVLQVQRVAGTGELGEVARTDEGVVAGPVVEVGGVAPPVADGVDRPEAKRLHLE